MISGVNNDISNFTYGERTYRMLAVSFQVITFFVGSARAFICLTTFRKRPNQASYAISSLQLRLSRIFRKDRFWSSNLYRDACFLKKANKQVSINSRKSNIFLDVKDVIQTCVSLITTILICEINLFPIHCNMR